MHIAKRNNLLGGEHAMMVMGAVQDFRSGFTRLCYGPNFEEKKADYLKNAKVHLDRFSAYLGTNDFICGELCFVDFALAEILDHHLEMDETFLNDHENVAAYHRRFFNLPKIAEYRASDRFQSLPVINESASWNL